MTSSYLTREVLSTLPEEKLESLLAPIQQFDYSACDKSLEQFTEASFEILDPEVVYSNNWHIGYTCEHLEMVTAGEILMLGLVIPPAHMKTLMASVCWPVWTWKDWPESRWLFSSYSSPLSTAHSLKRRRLIRSPWFQEGWGDKFQLVGDQDQKTIFENDHNGLMLATSTGGTTGGKHGDFIVIDDPINPEEAMSETARLKGNAHVRYLRTTRRRDPKTSRFVLIMQRLHEDDPVARLKEIFEKFGEPGKNRIIEIPAESPKKTTIYFPKSERVIEREEGEILWIERFPPEFLAEAREELGSYRYAAQYDLNPIPIEGGLVRQDWLRYYSELPKIKISGWFWDTAIKDKKTNDWSVGLLIGEADNGYYVMDIIREKLLYPELKIRTHTSMISSPASFIMIEDKSSGQQILQEFKKDKPYPVFAFEPIGDKTQRLSLVSPIIEAGKFFLPLDHPLTKKVVDEFIFFPQGKNDDCVDAGVMGLTYFHLRKKSGKFRKSLNLNSTPEAGSIGSQPKW